MRKYEQHTSEMVTDVTYSVCVSVTHLLILMTASFYLSKRASQHRRRWFIKVFNVALFFENRSNSEKRAQHLQLIAVPVLSASKVETATGRILAKNLLCYLIPRVTSPN